MIRGAASVSLWSSGLDSMTLRRLDVYVALLRKWNASINLVARASLMDVWTRHVHDSVQIFDLRGANCVNWVDFGSGAGFPGMVVAVLAKERQPGMRVSLVEADLRKAEFLRVVSRETGVGVTVHGARIESLPGFGADVVSARAVAPLTDLCSYAVCHLAENGRAIFPKGARFEQEVAAARQAWTFGLEAVPSQTDPDASILCLTDLRRA